MIHLAVEIESVDERMYDRAHINSSVPGLANSVTGQQMVGLEPITCSADYVCLFSHYWIRRQFGHGYLLKENVIPHQFTLFSLIIIQFREIGGKNILPGFLSVI